MRVLSRKFQCPSFICFSKSSPAFYSPPALRLEDAQHVSSSPSPVAVVLEENVSDEKVEDEKRGLIDGKAEVLPKSCLKKPAESGANEVEKGRVKWMDFTGKELVEIKEFEATESGDSEDDSDGYRSCICVIQ